jgi:predicted ester cyclase
MEEMLMNTQQRKEVARRFVKEVLGGTNPTAFEDLVAPDIMVETALSPSGPIRGRDTYRRIFSEFAAVFDWKSLEIEELFAEADGDQVVVRFRAVGDHARAFFGIAPSGRTVTFIETHVLRIREGRIIENRVGANNLEFAMLMAPVLAPQVLGPASQ